MDKNQVTGLILISLLMLGYFYFNQDVQPPPAEPIQQQETIQSPENVTPQVQEQTVAQPPDSLLRAQREAQFGALAAAMEGTSETSVLENDLVKITFDSKGGSVAEVLLKDYKTFDQEPLIMWDRQSHQVDFFLNLGGTEINVADLYFQSKGITTAGDSTTIHFQIQLPSGQQIDQYYTLGSGYQLRYNLETPGFEVSDPTTLARIEWQGSLKKIERGLVEPRRRSAINYYLSEGSFQDVGDGSNDLKEEIISQPLNWVAMKQKFFTSGLVADRQFTRGAVSSQVLSEEDSSVVKDLKAVLALPQQSLNEGGFTWYFGPNDLQTTKQVAEGFSKNVYLGWAVFAWLNKWLIIPVFNFLEGSIANYGIIIIILAFLIKLILSPISYKSYLSMAKMKVLKPQLDEIKDKFKDDTQKAQAAQMELYGKVGVNPLSGCIPMVLQMPILLAMFNFFPNSIQLRQAAFLWANDLSSYDSIMNLPFEIPFYGSHVSLFTLLMAGSTLLYTWSNQQMNTTVQGPMKSMQYLMPVMMIFFFNNFSSGLTFYYFVLNILNFGQQAIIKRFFIDEEKILKIMEQNKVRNKNKKKSKFQQRLEEAMKTAEETKKNKK